MTKRRSNANKKCAWLRGAGCGIEADRPGIKDWSPRPELSKGERMELERRKTRPGVQTPVGTACSARAQGQ